MPLGRPPDPDGAAPQSDAVAKTVPISPFTAGAVLGARYQMRHCLGQGGMGTVWQAFDLKLRVEVALKLLHVNLLKDRRRLEALRSEVRSARQVLSPNVCRIFDLIEVDGHELISMEYVDGQTLQTVLQARGPLPLKEAQQICSQLLAGLEAIHRAGLVHRDIKPENIMLTRSGRVLVMDFGVARQQSGDSGTVSGTPPYMAPEQRWGEAVDLRADVYSVGVVLAEMVSPGGVKEPGSRRAIWEGIHSEPIKLAPTPWAPVLRKAVARDREQRYDSALTLLRALEEVTLRVEGAEDLNPYPGLVPFTEKDVAYFFGREAEVEQLWRKLEGPARLLGVVGASGAGKSSFLRAGIIASATPEWAVLYCTPSSSPMASLRRALVSALGSDTEALAALATGEDTAMLLAFSRWRSERGYALLIIDQLEELFTLNPPETQSRFLVLLHLLPLDCDIHVVLSLRDDFLMECARHEALRPIVSELMLLQAPSGANLRRAMVHPAAKSGYHFEDDELVNRILGEVEGERGALPLLAFALARIWELRDVERGLLTHEVYREIGGVGGALARYAEDASGSFSDDQVAILRELFRNLVTAEGTRAVRRWDDLLSIFEESQREAAAEVLEALIGARLLTSYEVHEEDGVAQRRVEVIHESLLSAWPRLVRWRTQDTDGAQLRDQLRQAAQLWEQKDRSDDLLWIGTAYREFKLWRERYPGGLSSSEESFAKAMIKRATRRKKRRRMAIGGAFLALLLVLGIVGTSRQQAVAEAKHALASQLLLYGRAVIETSPTAALAYATRSLEVSDSPEGRLFAMEALAGGPPARVLPMGFGEDGVHDVVFSRDGAWAALRGYEGIQVVGRDGTNYRALESFAAQSFPGAVFDPMGRSLYGFSDHELRRWKVPGFELAAVCLLPEGSNEVVATRHGTFVLTSADADGSVVLSAYHEMDNKLEFIGRLETRVECGIDPDGKWLAYVWDGSLLVRSLEAWDRPPRRVASLERVVNAVRFIGERIAVVTGSGEIQIWPLAGAEAPLGVVPTGTSDFWEADPAGNRLAMFATQPRFQVAVWDLGSQRLDSHPRWCFPAAVPVQSGEHYFNGGAPTPGGDWVATANVSSVAFWPLRHDEPLSIAEYPAGSGFRFRDLAFTTDGQLLAVLMDENLGQERIEAWDLKVGGPSRTLAKVPLLAFPSLAIDPTGHWIAVTTTGGAAIVPLAGGPVRRLTGFDPGTWIGGIAFNPDGSSLAACALRGTAADKVIRIWDLETQEVVILGPIAQAGEGFAGQTMGLAFLPDGSLVSSGQGGMRRWNIQENTSEVITQCSAISRVIVFGEGRYLASTQGKEPECSPQVTDLRKGVTRVFSATGGPFMAVDPSGSILAFGNTFGKGPSVLVGPVSGEAPHLLVGQGPVYGLAISPDGRWIASGSFQQDPSIRLWPMPDVTRTPLQALPRKELLVRLNSLTNVRVVPDPTNATTWKLETGRFLGWESAPAW